MAEFKLYYFDSKAVAEGIRMLLTYGGQEFKDERFDLEGWSAYKPKAADIFYETNDSFKETKFAEYSKNVFPGMLDKLNSIVEKNNGHIAANKLSWGDFLFAGMFDYFKLMLRIPDLEVKYPAFKTLIDNVYSIPKIKAYDKAAPKSIFGY